jgi:hypothetical protein
MQRKKERAFEMVNFVKDNKLDSKKKIKNRFEVLTAARQIDNNKPLACPTLENSAPLPTLLDFHPPPTHPKAGTHSPASRRQSAPLTSPTIFYELLALKASGGYFVDPGTSGAEAGRITCLTAIPFTPSQKKRGRERRG